MMTQHFMIRNNSTGELFSSKGRYTFPSVKNAKVTWSTRNLPYRWDRDHGNWEILPAKIVPDRMYEERVTVDEWLREDTSYGSRFDWAAEEVGPSVPKNLEKWLRIAYLEGARQGAT